MSEQRWAEVERYFTELLVSADPARDATLEVAAAAGLPPHDVSPPQGKLLHLLALAQGARAILEIGTLAGYSTIWLARALPADGRLLTIEADRRHASVARENLARTNLDNIVELRVGQAQDLLPEIAAEGRGPFDLIFIDADKRSNTSYLPWVLALSRRGSVIVADNVVRGGAVADPAAAADPHVDGVRRFTEMLANEPRLSATAIQTVGSKGYDGFVLAVVTADP